MTGRRLLVLVALAAPTAVCPRPAAAAPRDLAGRVVVLDPGHDGGNATHPAAVARLVWAGTMRKACDTVGAASASGYPEWAFTLDVARRARRLLAARGARVVLTRRTNRGVGPCIDRRAAIGNRAHADAAVSIHADGGPTGGRGFHVIYPVTIPGLTDDIARPSLRLALAVRGALAAGSGLHPADYVGRDGLDRRGDLGGLDLSDVPKVFVECGNLRNARDARVLEAGTGRARIAAALVRGIAAFLHRR